nr:MAG: hypothetical protein DIU78_22200 [Pseudomonadota bacterium]
MRLVSRFALARGTVTSAHVVGGFQRLVLKSDAKKPAAGTKLQLLLPSDDVRTYSPIPSPDGIVLLGWTRAGGPGARWMSNARVGDVLPFVGPQRSLELAAGPVVLVGDETSVAVAAALAVERPGEVHAVIQSDTADGVRAAAESVGLRRLDVVPRGDTAATLEAVKAKLSRTPNAIVAVTGGSELVVAVRDALRRAGVTNVKTKTYWIPGKTGLD